MKKFSHFEILNETDNDVWIVGYKNDKNIRLKLGDFINDNNSTLNDIIQNGNSIDKGLIIKGEGNTELSKLEPGDSYIGFLNHDVKVNGSVYLGDEIDAENVKSTQANNWSGPIEINKLKVYKNKDNSGSFIQNGDKVEGWINEDLHINGIWLGDDNPSSIDLSDIDNWTFSSNEDVNITSVKLVGSSLFENKAINDFAQIGDIQNAITGVNYFGSFDSVDDIEVLDGNEGDFATLNFGVEQYLYQLTDAGWRAVNGLFVEGLKVKKRPNNLDFKIIQTYDFCEGWISPNLFVKGLWKGADEPTLSQMQDKNNWSEFIEIE